MDIKTYDKLIESGLFYAFQYLLMFVIDVSGVQNEPFSLERLYLARIPYSFTHFATYTQYFF